MYTPDGEQIWGDALEEYENDVAGPYLCYDTLSLAVEDAFVGPPVLKKSHETIRRVILSESSQPSPKREFSAGYDPHRFDHTKSDGEFPSDYEAKPNYDGPGYDVSDSDAEQLAIFYSSMWSAPQTSPETTPRIHSFADTGIITEDSDMESRDSIPESSESDSPYESEYSTEDTDSDGSEDPGYTFHSSKTLASAPRSFGEQYSRDCGLGAVSSMIRSGASFLGLTARG